MVLPLGIPLVTPRSGIGTTRTGLPTARSWPPPAARRRRAPTGPASRRRRRARRGPASWRRAHGFSSADAPDAKEFALRMAFNKGMITPQLTEAMLAVVAPELMSTVRQKASEATGAEIPAEINQMLQGGEAPAAAEPTTPPLAEPGA